MEYYKGLMNSLARGVVSPVYLLYGEEEYLKEKAVAKFREVLLPQAADFNLDLLDGETAELPSVVALAENLPFMAERRLVIVKSAPWFSSKGKSGGDPAAEGKAGSQEGILLQYLSNPSPTTCLIFIARDSVDRRKKLFKAVSAAGAAIDFKALKAQEMVTWVNQRLKAASKQIEPAAAKALVEVNGKLGLLNLQHEVEKLLCYLGERNLVELQDVQQVAVNNIEQNIFNVVDDVASGQTSRALHGIRELLAQKEQPPKILALLARQFRIALQVAILAKEGYAEREMASRLGLPDFVVRKTLQQCQRSGATKIRRALQQLAELDADMKRGQQDFPSAIETMLINFSRS
ncbi:DNA polymerase III subunit delta [Desulforamulus aeronauticus]|uniref:DNA polymerase III subunit delta n=1 Tax=Desulforamulus aeronauticus DSM 10349 TaxID=1121421 RepID=A0A1M6VCK9_9FIRM|nr:DNA polymerase III subunit delta [Desulforamulus aeronauticus]SHK79121.1 DNA polymerase III, delta subunit [Desulforamulus aeronauticus DSM 10349]